jgi:hypothetical protein
VRCGSRAGETDRCEDRSRVEAFSREAQRNWSQMSIAETNLDATAFAAERFARGLIAAL